MVFFIKNCIVGAITGAAISATTGAIVNATSSISPEQKTKEFADWVTYGTIGGAIGGGIGGIIGLDLIGGGIGGVVGMGVLVFKNIPNIPGF